MGGAPNFMRSSGGFTMVELLAVVAVTAIILTSAAPNLRQLLANQQVKEVTRGLLSGAQEARSFAISRNGNVGVVFRGKSWCVFELRTATVPTCDTSTPVLAAGELRKFIASPSPSVTVTTQPTGAAQIMFNSLGRPVNNIDGSDTVISFDVMSTAGSNRQYRADFTDGALRMCEIGHYAAGDPRAC